ncbi:pentatricopeptide repeat-containing protein At3g26540-like isoform X1 [Zingiber officinale]|uniref:Pentatricopeptide repeat-containing protein n=1 Tax=Zingiber officinale TaxID=94328 RepID=A0A8J5HM95_ZINOF|nr:pentatricopeptide repeat-containing protein At3g26540-like isoform X1 [Zingiber officinale]KAG6526842.1 hypothetical protein ZIOFF_016845 [Zingiber officinale]
MAATARSLLDRLIQHAVGPKRTSPAATSASTIIRHLDSGDLRKAIATLSSSASPFPDNVYASLLHLCSSRRSLVDVRRVESHLVAFSPSSSPSIFLLNRTIVTYARCGSPADARELFDEMPTRDGGTWNAMISAYALSDCPNEAVSLFSRMNSAGIRPKDVTLASVLGCCADLLASFLARQIHCLILKYGYLPNVILDTSVVDVYGKCLEMNDARKMFDLILHPNEISWNVIVRRYLEAGSAGEAMLMFFQMIREGVKPLSFTVSNTLKACSKVLALKEGNQIHAYLLKTGFEGDNVVGCSLMDVYAKCGVVDDARQLFDQLPCKDVVSWTSMISGYVACGRVDEAEKIFEEMPERNVISWNALLAGYIRFFCWDKASDFFCRMWRETGKLDLVSLGLQLNACAGISDLDRGKQIHGFAYRHNWESDKFFRNQLVDMYAKCGNLRNAEISFSIMADQRDTVSWNSLISGYIRYGRSEETLVALSEMQRETIPNEFTFTTILAACANIFMLDVGKQIHAFMVRNGFQLNAIVRGALVDMYSKCRLIEYAIKIFEEESTRDLILWNTIILGCAYNGRGEQSLDLFEEMKKEVAADNVTFIGVLLACVSQGYVDLGRRYFDSMSNEYGIIPRIEHYECMIELLGKYGWMVELEDFIQRLPFEPTIPMWIRIFDCCREHGNIRLGERAAKFINESNPLTPVQFEIIPRAGHHMPCSSG